jgi:hypothetical protein
VFTPRRIVSRSDWSDSDGIKIYTISASGRDVDHRLFTAQLGAMKAEVPLVWNRTPAFCIFHEGASAPYLVLGWWGNDNELFTRVAVREPEGWAIDPLRYSFCLWDLEVMWHERLAFIETMYGGLPDLASYRLNRHCND